MSFNRQAAYPINAVGIINAIDENYPTNRGLFVRITASAGTSSQIYDKIGQTTTYLQITQPIQVLNGRVDQLLSAGILKIFGE